MSRAALSMLVFGVYMAVEALGLLIAPHFVARLFQLPAPLDHWVRIVGIALAVFAFYYVLAARAEVTAFFRFTVYGRTLQFVLFLALIVAQVAPAALLLATATEFAAGLWTYFALKADARSPKAAPSRAA